MSSQFKKKRTTLNKTKGRKSSIISVSKKLQTNNAEDFKTEIEGIEQQNKDILGSLVQEGQEQPKEDKSEILKRVETSQQNVSRRSHLRSNLRSKQDVVGKKSTQNFKKKSKEDISELGDVDGGMFMANNMMDPGVLPNDDNFNKNKDASFTNYNAYITGKKEEEKPKNWPKAMKGGYGDDKEVALTLIVLKKLVKSLDEENSKLRENALSFEMKEKGYRSQIQDLKEQVNDLVRENQMVLQKPHQGEKIDLNSLDARLKAMDENLKKATGENSHEEFLKDVVFRSKEFVQKSKSTANDMRKMKNDLSELRMTLKNLNN